MVFVNQMLLMMAGDGEPNPGPGEGGVDGGTLGRWGEGTKLSLCGSKR